MVYNGIMLWINPVMFKSGRGYINHSYTPGVVNDRNWSELQRLMNCCTDYKYFQEEDPMKKIFKSLSLLSIFLLLSVSSCKLQV